MMLGVPPKGLKPVSYRTQVPGWAVRVDAGLTALPWFVEGPCPSTPGPRGHPRPPSAKATWAASKPEVLRELQTDLPPARQPGGSGRPCPL